MVGQDYRKKKDNKSSKGVKALKYLMGQRFNKEIMIGGSLDLRWEKEKEGDRNKG